MVSSNGMLRSYCKQGTGASNKCRYAEGMPGLLQIGQYLLACKRLAIVTMEVF